MMPKPFFIFALLPGFIVGELFTHEWVNESAFFLANASVYSAAVFAVVAVIRRVTQAISDK